MHIVVLAKPQSTQPRQDATGQGPTPDAPTTLSPHAKAPLRLAQALKATNEATITLLALGPQSAQATLQQAIETTGDQAIHVTGDAVTGGDAWATAHALEAALHRLDPAHLILAGTPNPPHGHGMTPPHLATLLEIPLLPRATRLSLDPQTDTATAKTTTHRYEETLTAPLPLLATISPTHEPHLPTAKDRLALNQEAKAQHERVQRYPENLTTWTIDDLDVHENLVGWRGSPTLTLDAEPPKPPQRETRDVTPDDDEALQTIAERLTGGPR